MQTTITPKREILFIVYKPQWWGCFDSIYRELCEEEGTSCYVIPIPYYKRNRENYEADFSKGIYQPEKLPKDVPVTDYRTFSFDEHDIDTIYIHHPFDNACITDTSHPDYYSANLKRYAKRLVYVPHLLFTDEICEAYQNCPAYKNVDQIRLSSQDAKYSLESIYDEKLVLMEDGIGKYLNKLTAAKSDRTDGKRPLRLLFSVTFQDISRGSEKFLKKLEQVLNYLKTRDDIKLIYRPDEEIAARERQLSPEIRKEYLRIMYRFVQEHMGEYDDSQDLYQAAVDADALIGMLGNPLQPLFGAQGKKTLWLNTEAIPIPSEDELCTPIIWGGTVEEDYFWFVPEFTSLICRMSLLDGHTEVVAEVPVEEKSALCFEEVQKEGNKLYLIPYAGDGIWVYDIGVRNFTQIYLPEAVSMNFCRSARYRDKIYMIPRFYPGIVKLDMQTEEITVLNEWIKSVDEVTDSVNQNEMYFILGCCQEDDKLYLASAKADALVILDMESDQCEVLHLGISGEKFEDLVKDGDDIYLIPYLGSRLWKWNLKEGKAELIHTAAKSEEPNIPYSRMLKSNRYILAFPWKEQNILQIDKGTKRIQKITDKMPCKDADYRMPYIKETLGCGYTCVTELPGHKKLVYETYDGAFLILDENAAVLKKFPCRLPGDAVYGQYDALLEQMQRDADTKNCITEQYSLLAALEYLKHQNH